MAPLCVGETKQVACVSIRQGGMRNRGVFLISCPDQRNGSRAFTPSAGRLFHTASRAAVTLVRACRKIPRNRLAPAALCSEESMSDLDRKEYPVRNITFSVLLAAGLAMAAPAYAETDFNNVLTGIAQSLMSQQLDQNAYAAAQNLNTVSGYRNYLAKFPNGVYRLNAEQALARLGAVVDPRPTPLPDSGAQSAAYIEASLGLSRSQRILIQRQLTAIGYPTGVADGLWGANTRKAIARWQTANRLTATGYVTAQQVSVIGQQAGTAVGPGPDGTVTGDDPVEESLLSLTYVERRDIQMRLTRLGYNTYGADGVFGRNTRRALATWQRDAGLRVTGYLTADELRSLRRQSGG